MALRAYYRTISVNFVLQFLIISMPRSPILIVKAQAPIYEAFILTLGGALVSLNEPCSR